MPFSSGIYTPPSLPGSWNPAISGQTATPDDFNTLLTDLSANGLSVCICRDGQSTITANIPFSGFRITGLGSSAALTDATTAGNVQNSTATYAIDTGTADVYAIAPTPAVSAYAVGQAFAFKSIHASLTTTPTLAVSGLTAGTITYPNGDALVAGDIPLNGVVTVRVSALSGSTPTFQLQSGTTAYIKGSGTINQLAWFAATGKTISGLATANSGLLVTSGAGVPSISSTIPNGVIATTQSASDNSTKLATTAYVDAASPPTVGTSWTPADASGAALSFTTVSGRYVRIGPRVFVDGQFTYPATADGSAAKVTLPVALPNSAYAVVPGTLYVSGATPGTSGTVMGIINTATVGIYNSFINSGAALVNSDLSGAVVKFHVEYLVA